MTFFVRVLVALLVVDVRILVVVSVKLVVLVRAAAVDVPWRMK
jgi:hypothetical protein